MINLADIRLEPEAESLLRKGLNFAVTPKKVPVDDIITSTEDACRTLPAEQANHLRNDVVKTLKRAKTPKQNITAKERKALMDLKKNKDIMILGADKGRATVIMKTTDYRSKIENLLNDKDTYEELKKDPTSNYKNKLINILRPWKSNKSIPEKLYHRIYPTSEVPPKFYGLPKIHKKDVPLRPIVSSIGNISYHVAEYLTSVLSPLMGKNPHFIKNSQDFIKKIRGLEIPPGRKMVSYDVTALFTSIPVDAALDIIRKKLENDTTFPERCELSITQIMTLLEFCLRNTYFVYNNTFYKQQQGAAMGSSVSPVIANLYMENFEELALRTAPRPPSIWLRYVNDTFVVLHEYDVESFTEHINSIDQHIKFTIEPEQNSLLPFLDTQIILNDDASIDTKVYRKPTHTDQYLNWFSNHPLQHKRSVARTLIERASTIPSSEKEKEQELTHIKEALTANGYQPWIMNIPQKKPRQVTSKEKSSRRSHPVGIPYVKDLSENLQRIFQSYNVPTYHKPVNTLKNLLVKPKDKTKLENQCGVVYHIECQECKQSYIGETGRNLGIRFKEHTSRQGTNSAVKDHIHETGHKISIDNVKIIDKEENWHRRKIREAIQIARRSPTLNRDKGLELPPVYNSLLSHDPQWSCDTSAPFPRH